MNVEPLNYSLDLSFTCSESSFKRYLEERIGLPISLVFTENSTTMLSMRKRNGVLYLRLHRLFVNSGNEVLDEIVSYLQGSRHGLTRFR